MSYAFKNGQTSVILRVKFLDSTSTTGAGLTGLTSASAGLIIATASDVEAATTAYTVAGSTIEAVTTLGTYLAPTATKCRFKEFDATNHKGVYEIQLADARYAIANAKSLIVSWSGATNLVQGEMHIPLNQIDPYSTFQLGVLDAGTAQAATSTTIQIRAGATFTTSQVVGATVFVTSGTTGFGERRLVTAYNGATNTATVDAFTTTPTGTITYILFATAPVLGSFPVNVVKVNAATVYGTGIPVSDPWRATP